MSNAAEDHTVGHPRLTLLEAQVKNWMTVLMHFIQYLIRLGNFGHFGKECLYSADLV